MKDPNLSELVRSCIRCWLYLVPQAFLGIHLFDMFMRRKNSIKPLMIWQLLRVFLIGGISDIILRGYYGNESWWGILMMFCSVVIMIANTVLIYYTFEGSLPKVVLGAMLADIVTSMIHYPAICIVDLLSGRPLYILKCPVEPWDLLIPVLEYLFYRLEKKTILHVLRRYRDFEARYLKIIWVFVYFLPVLYYVPNGLTDIQVMFLDDILIILIMVFSILSIVQRQRRVIPLPGSDRADSQNGTISADHFGADGKNYGRDCPNIRGDAETVYGQSQSDQSSGAAGDLLQRSNDRCSFVRVEIQSGEEKNRTALRD